VLLALASLVLAGACLHAQRQTICSGVDPKPLFGTFYSLQKVANGDPSRGALEPSRSRPGRLFQHHFRPNFLVYFYSDLEVNYGTGGHRYSTQTSDPPEPPGGGGTEGDDPALRLLSRATILHRPVLSMAGSGGGEPGSSPSVPPPPGGSGGRTFGWSNDGPRPIIHFQGRCRNTRENWGRKWCWNKRPGPGYGFQGTGGSGSPLATFCRE